MNQWDEFEFENTNGGGKTNNYSSSVNKGGSWEDLRKQARQLENQIDIKLVALAKLGTSYGSSTSATFSNSDKSPLLTQEDSSQEFRASANEIESLLAKLSMVNQGMDEYASKQGQSAAIHHTLQRHRDILQDYQQEFKKTKSNIKAMLDREDLLNSVHREINDYRNNVSGGGNKSNRRMDMLLKESESARNSERLIDEQINIAIESRETLVNQRAAFKAIQTKLNDISNRFPMINSLVQKINLRKRRDSIIMGVVIGLCLTFMLWYMFG